MVFNLNSGIEEIEDFYEMFICVVHFDILDPEKMKIYLMAKNLK
jgi:hypothetical protein